MTPLRFPHFIAICLIGLSLAPPPALAEEGTLVGVNTVRTEPLKQTVPVIGRLIAGRSGVVSARAAGPVGEMKAQVGDRVKKNDVIAVLIADTLHWMHQLAKAEASGAASALQTARVALDLRSQELKRLNQLKKSAAFSQARLEDKNLEVASARSAVAEAQATLSRSKANQKLAAINLMNAKIKAPFDGIVSQRHINVGAYVNVGAPVIDLIDDSNLEIEASVPARRIAGLVPGSIVSFQLETEKGSSAKPLPATVRAVVPSEDPLTRTRKVRFKTNFTIFKSNLATNQSVVLALPAGEAGAVVTVHKDAVISRKGQNIVYLVEQGQANVRPIKLGQAIGSRFVVLEGLISGDIVVVRGNERLRPGQKVHND